MRIVVEGGWNARRGMLSSARWLWSSAWLWLWLWVGTQQHDRRRTVARAGCMVCSMYTYGIAKEDCRHTCTLWWGEDSDEGRGFFLSRRLRNRWTPLMLC